ncbi:MAG TPA: apolipoprotein N-acyltransferase [Pyrinomonadaceae bacterium]|nr:apolipoprotein N-acyltransferase [Pyrinomonadaceae bacterium]
MEEAVSPDAPQRGGSRLRALAARVRAAAPAPNEALRALLSALLLVLSFPDFGLWPLAWVALAPLFLTIARRPRAPQAFLLGWLTGTLYFYGSCHWLTFPMIHYGELPAPLAYVLLLFPTMAAALFPAACTCVLARLCSRLGARALVFAPLLWVSLEWARLGVIGQLWNAVGYSLAEVPTLIQAARFGGVYAVGFLVVSVNAALAYALSKRSTRATVAALAAMALVALLMFAAQRSAPPTSLGEPAVVVVALQPNIIPDFKRSAAEMAALGERHFALSEAALVALDEGRAGGTSIWPEAGTASNSVDERARLSSLPRVVIWPESPMNFTFARDAPLRERIGRFVREHRTSLLLNSLEPAPDDGGYNAAVLINEEARLAVQYDKIRLMPFGEYVPLPRWMPGAGLVRGIVGDFTPGTRFTLMPLGGAGAQAPKAGVFICLESAYPYIPRRFTEEGADVLVEITNDAYQGDTAVIRQHLANAVFRAVETGRPLLRVTNTGITARITTRGEVLDATEEFSPAVRTWAVARSDGQQTFYVRHGDAFVVACSLLSVAAFALSLRRSGKKVF